MQVVQVGEFCCHAQLSVSLSHVREWSEKTQHTVHTNVRSHRDEQKKLKILRASFQIPWHCNSGCMACAKHDDSELLCFP